MSRLSLNLELPYTFIATHQQAKWHTHRHLDISKAYHKDQKVGGGPVLETPTPFPLPQDGYNTLPLKNLWNYPSLWKLTTPYHGAAVAWDGPLCGVYFSLNKCTSYLSLCFPLNSSCNETSWMWTSSSPETLCVISVNRSWFKCQSVLHGFTSKQISEAVFQSCFFLSCTYPIYPKPDVYFLTLTECNVLHFPFWKCLQTESARTAVGIISFGSFS